MAQVLLSDGFLTSYGFVGGVWGRTFSASQSLFSVSGTLYHLYVKVAEPPGEGKSHTFTVRKNGVSTSLAVTIANSETEQTNDINSVSVEPGDLIAVRLVQSGAPTQSNARYSLAFYTDSPFETNLSGDGSAGTYFSLMGSGSSTVENSMTFVADYGGTLSDFRISISTPPGTGKSLTYIVRVNGVDTELTVTISDTDTTGSNLLDSVDVSPGDRVAVRRTSIGSPPSTTSRLSLKFSGLTTFVFGGVIRSWVASSQAIGYNLELYAERYDSLANDMEVESMHLYLTDAPGVSNSIRATLTKKNIYGVESETDLYVEISGNDTTGNASGSVTLLKGETFYLKWSQAGSPSFGDAIWGFSARSLVAVSSSPTVSTQPATEITAIQAILNGLLVYDGGSGCTCGFQWGETTEYGNTTSTESKATGETFSQTIAPPLTLEWALTSNHYYSGTHSVYCGHPTLYEYQNDQTSILPMANSVDLSGTTSPVLSFYLWSEIEEDYDYLYVDVSTNNGFTWTEDIWDHTGEEADWLAKVEIDLGGYKASEVKIRFRFVTDESVTYEGAYIDDVEINDGATPIFSDDFESGTSGWAFTSISGWVEGITYHFRAFATNVLWTSYGADLTFTYPAETRCFTIPDLFDDHGRVAKGARVRAYRADTLAFITESVIDQYGNATICGLPLDVDVVFFVTWGGGYGMVNERREVTGIEL